MRRLSFRRVVDGILEAVLAVLMGGMVVAVLWQVFTRFVLRTPSSFTEELVRFGLVWLGLFGASYGFGKKSHLAIDLLARRMTARQGALLDLFVQLAVASFALLVLVIGGRRLVVLTLDFGQTSAALSVERGYVYAALPISGAIVCFYAVVSIVESFPRAFPPRTQ